MSVTLFFSIIRAKRVSNCYIQKKKSVICACVRLILILVGGRQTAVVVARYDSMIPSTYQVCIMYQIRMYLVSAGRNLYVRTLSFCFCFPFLFQHGTPTFLVTKILGICVRSFIRREKENPPEILYTKREIPRGAS